MGWQFTSQKELIKLINYIAHLERSLSAENLRHVTPVRDSVPLAT